MIGILTSLFIVDWGLILEKQRIKEAVNVARDAIQQAQLLAITKRQKQRLDAKQQSIWIGDSPKFTNKILFDKVADDIDIRITGKLIFAPYGFGSAGSMTLQSPNYSARIVINSLGGVRLENIALKTP